LDCSILGFLIKNNPKKENLMDARQQIVDIAIDLADDAVQNYFDMIDGHIIEVIAREHEMWDEDDILESDEYWALHQRAKDAFLKTIDGGILPGGM
jgi:hypothetical protein